MSRRDARRWVAALGVLLIGGVACEQNSPEWFPHMKRQPAVQAYEELTYVDRAPGQGFTPPEGAVPIDGGEVRLGRLDPAADALVNPRDPRDLRSLEKGEELYGIYCQVCHGRYGLGDGPVSATGEKQGPFGGVFPLVGLVTGRTDGYLYNVIRLGSGGNPAFRMPSYDRIPVEGRWDIVNYVRYLDAKGGRP